MVVVFGSINVDLVARVDHLPRAGETQSAHHYAVYAGGKGANQALAARRAGAEVALAGAVGRDDHASLGLAALVAAGVDTQAVARVDAPTGLALIHVDRDGQNTITVVPGANAHVRATQVSDALMSEGSTLLLTLETPLLEAEPLVRRARQRGVRTMLNASPAHRISAVLLAGIDVLIVNQGEAEALAHEHGLPAAAEDFAAAATERFGTATIVTLGAQGALAAAGSSRYRTPSPKVEVVDTTAAGDAFAGALAARLDRREPWAQALAFAAAAGALACTREGAQPSLPREAAIAALAATLHVEDSLREPQRGLSSRSGRHD